MATYDEILNTEIDPDSPLTTSLAFRIRDNPLAGLQGDPSAIAEDVGVWIDKDGQSAIITDETDTAKVLRPNGSGGAEWGSSAGASYHRAGMTSAGGGVRTLGDGNGGSVVLNVGGITFSSGEFTVPFSGLYLVQWSVSGDGDGEVQVNGTGVASELASFSANNPPSACSVVLNLSASDVVRIRQLTGTSVSGAAQITQL